MMFAGLPQATLCFFKKGECLIEQGDNVKYVYYIVEGSVYGMTMTKNGLQTIHYIKGDDDRVINSLAGLLVIFVPKPSISSFVANSDCSCYRIPADILMKCIMQQPLLLKDALELAMNNYYLLYEKLEKRQQKGAVQELTQFLLSKVEKNQRGEYVIYGKYSNNDISHFCGIHPVTTAKILKRLREQQVIERTKEGTLVKDIVELEEYARGKKNLSYRYYNENLNE